MVHIQGYIWGETLYQGAETYIRRITPIQSDERLVVKLPTADTPSLRTIGRLVHEYKILSKLAQVAGVARAWRLQQEAGSAALWLQDPGKRSLDRVLSERNRLPPEIALRIALELCRVLQGVHEAGVVHKDVKPQNILVDEACTQVVLIDFGIASELAQEATEATMPEALEGTLAYISPEQTGRTARGLDARTDLYSLGVTLFELLSGQRPFLETDPLALVYAHLAKAPPALESLSPGMPAVVSRLVERCLQKHPEQRYQTAKGLAADLLSCLDQLAQRGTIEPFALGQADFSPKLQIPQTLVSRESESQVIAGAFARAAAGMVEVLLVSGPSGVGKTALVHSVYRQIAQAGRGLLLAGKHDQLGRSVPYAALAQAFSGFMSSLAASPKSVFEDWRQRLDKALGPRMRLIADVVPAVEWLMGPLAALPVVPAEMMYNRIKLSWIEFVRAVTDASPPLVLFLDDLQWMDPASVELLKTLLTDVGCKHLLVIAAYRDNEAPDGHLLWTLIDGVAKSGVPTPRLTVGPLSSAAVKTWLAETLTTAPERVDQLAETLHQKTRGNPFFLGQLLLELYRQKRVRRNLDDGVWEWDQDAVERAAVTDNVVELMRSKVVELPETTQELLGQAACAGHSFSFDELTVLTGRTQPQVAQQLWPALLAGLLLPIDGHYRESQALAETSALTSTAAAHGPNHGLEARYRFLHDRVQQAFYERIAPEHRARTHLQIGQRLHRVFEQQGGTNQKQLELVRHLNLGAAALQSEAEKKDLARMNLRAAKVAKEGGSYGLQATLVEQGKQLLGEDAWDEDPQLAADLALERIEADFMLRDFAAVHRRTQELLAMSLPALPRLAAQELRVRACVAAGQFGDGVRLGLDTLAEQGIHYPESDPECSTLALKWIGECDAWLDEHPEGCGSLASSTALEHLLCDALEAATLLCAGMGIRPGLAAVALARNVKQMIAVGRCTRVTPLILSLFAHGRSAFTGEYRGGLRWAHEGEQSAIRMSSPFFPECSFIRGIYAVYELPAERARVYYQAAVRVATTSGSFQGTSWGLFGELYYVDLWGGATLEQVAAREESQRALMTRAGDARGRHMFALATSYVAFLRSSENARPDPTKDWLTASSQWFLAQGVGMVAEFARVQEAHLFLMFGEWARARARAEDADRFRPNIYAVPPVTDIPLWRGLAAGKCWSRAMPEAEQKALADTIEHSLERMRYFAACCEVNFIHKLCLLEAEHARILGHTEKAMAKYDEAIGHARRACFLHIEALAAQLCADFHLQAGRERFGALYLQDARDAYYRWGALAVVGFLEQKYPALLLRPAVLASSELPHNSTPTSTTGSSRGPALDVDTTIRAAQALASELDGDRVVAQLMRLVQENAGAERAALLLCPEGALVIAALLSNSQVSAGLGFPLSASDPIASSVVDYVLRTRESVLLSDAPTDSRFAQDLRFSSAAVRSVVAVPLTHQGRLSGLLYLEHAAANAFSPARLNLLSVLASQSAIALENARLYKDLQAANAGLEFKVAQRTAALDKALKELWAEMDLARKIQSVLLPPAQLLSGRYEFAGHMRPADEVGGDYFDALEAGGKLWVLIGDVSGHGISAGLIMMMVQTAVRSLVHSFAAAALELTPARLLTLVNRSVWSNLQLIGQGQYMTLTALCIDERQAVYSGLHQSLLWFRATTKQVEEVESHGCWLGLLDEIEGLNTDRRVDFSSGDVLLLHTDGLTELRRASDGSFLELSTVAECFRAGCCAQLSSEELTRTILALSAEGIVKDDISVVTLRRH